MNTSLYSSQASHVGSIPFPPLQNKKCPLWALFVLYCSGGIERGACRAQWAMKAGEDGVIAGKARGAIPFPPLLVVAKSAPLRFAARKIFARFLAAPLPYKAYNEVSTRMLKYDLPFALLCAGIKNCETIYEQGPDKASLTNSNPHIVSLFSSKRLGGNPK